MNISKEEAAIVLGVGRSTIYAWQQRGDMPEPPTTEAIEAYLQKERARLDEIQRRLILVRMSQSTSAS